MAEEFLTDIIAANEAEPEKTTEVLNDLAADAKKQDVNVPDGSEAPLAESQDVTEKQTETPAETEQAAESNPAVE